MANERPIKINERTPKEPSTSFVLASIETGPRKTPSVCSRPFSELKSHYAADFSISMEAGRFDPIVGDIMVFFFHVDGVVFYNGVFFFEPCRCIYCVNVIASSGVMLFGVWGFISERESMKCFLRRRISWKMLFVLLNVCKCFLEISSGGVSYEFELAGSNGKMLMWIDRFKF